MHDRYNREYHLLTNRARQESMVHLCGLQTQFCYARLCFVCLKFISFNNSVSSFFFFNFHFLFYLGVHSGVITCSPVNPRTRMYWTVWLYLWVFIAHMFRASHKRWEVAILILINTSTSVKFRSVEMDNWLNLNKPLCWDSICDPFTPEANPCTAELRYPSVFHFWKIQHFRPISLQFLSKLLAPNTLILVKICSQDPSFFKKKICSVNKPYFENRCGTYPPKLKIECPSQILLIIARSQTFAWLMYQQVVKNAKLQN